MASKPDGAEPHRPGGPLPQSRPERLQGLETEYAIRFTPEPGHVRPGNHVIYDALSASISDIVRTRPGETRGGEGDRIFTEGGASFCYEHLPHAPAGGLIEGATPECAEPAQLLLYQRAVDELLLQALEGARGRLERRGYRGELGLLKNCRDAAGHIYGAQENYEASIAVSSGALVLYRALMAVVVPIVVIHTLLVWAVLLLLVAVTVPVLLLALAAVLLVRPWRESEWLARLTDDDDPTALRTLGRVLRPLDMVLTYPVARVVASPIRWLAFRSQRRDMLGCLISRPVLTGAGSIGPDGRFGLSEKGPAIRRVIRTSPSPENRPLLDNGNLIKDLFALQRFRLRPLLDLFRQRQRLQLGLSDSNMAHTAEYLKIALTQLVLDMAEAGALANLAPQPADPIGALKAIVADPSLSVTVAIRGQEPLTALQLQRRYLQLAKRYLARSRTPSLAARRVIVLWEQVLDQLERDPAALIGDLDWVTKRYLLETCTDGGSPEARKKIDLRYHELGSGYFARLEAAGLTKVLVDRQEVRKALRSPPEQTPARARGQLVRQLCDAAVPAKVGWSSVRIRGGTMRGRVIHLPLKRQSNTQKG